MMILELGAPVSLAGIQWLEQYLGEFDFTIKEMESMSCHEIFTFCPSRRYSNKSLVEIPCNIHKEEQWQRQYAQDPSLPG